MFPSFFITFFFFLKLAAARAAVNIPTADGLGKWF